MPYIPLGELNEWQMLKLVLAKMNTMEVKMSEITGAVGRLQSSVNQAIALIRSAGTDQTDKIVALQEALATEREATAALVRQEDAEDVEQNAALDAARAEVDRLTAEITQGAADIEAQASALDAAIASRNSGVDEPATTTPEPADETPVAEPEPTPANDGDGSLPTPTTGTDGTTGDDAPAGDEVPAEEPTTGVDEPATTPDAPAETDESGNTVQR